MHLTKKRLAVLLAPLALTSAAVAVAQGGEDGRIGPDRQLLNNGRHLQPEGRLVKLGQFPTGGALTTDSRFYWTVSTGRGPNDVRIVSVRTGKVTQTLPLPGASGGIAMDPSRRLAYVSGVADSSHRGQQSPPGTPGVKGDVIQVFRYDSAGRATFDHLIPVPPPSSAAPPQSFPPTTLSKVAWPDRLAVSPDGSRLLVPLNLGDAAAIVDVESKRVRYVQTGNYPYGAAILRDGRTGLVSNETPGTVSVIDLDSAKKLKDVAVGPHLSHPEAIAVDPKADRAYVAVANSDQVAVIDTRTFTVERTLSVGRPEGLGASPVALTVSQDGGRLLVADAGADEIAVFSLPQPAATQKRAASRHRTARRKHKRAARKHAARKHKRAAREHAASKRAAGKPAASRQAEAGEQPGLVRKASSDFALVARIPTAQYPTDVQIAPAVANPCGFADAGHRHGKGAKRPKRCEKLLYVSGKGLGTGPNPNGPNPTSPNDSDDDINKTEYLPLLNVGVAGIADWPSPARLQQLSAVAERQLVPTNHQAAPADTPLRPGGPIKHVFYIVRENRTYDQVLGDLGKGDSDPKLSLFGRDVTPNAHAFADRFPLLDHVFANSEASIDGHFWTSAAKVSDYVNKAWFQNYGGRGRPYDFGVYAVSWPSNGFLFDQAERQGVSWFNYGEAVAGVIGLFPDKDRDAQETQEVNAKFLKSDLGAGAAACYPNDASIGDDAITKQMVFDSSRPPAAPPTAESRADCFRTKFAAQSATGSVPAFNYLVLTNDHTQVLSAGKRTPRAMVADNDLGLGQIVDTITHSPIWKDSAIFVVEDDSQDGADHVDAHRIPAFVLSPYARPGALVHTRYDFLSVIRSIELVLGMKPLGLFDQLATPMYDAFQADPANGAPYDAITPKVDLMETNPKTGPGARASARLPTGLDRIPQREMDRLLWKSVHGWNAESPPPGPNGVPGG